MYTEALVSYHAPAGAVATGSCYVSNNRRQTNKPIQLYTQVAEREREKEGESRTATIWHTNQAKSQLTTRETDRRETTNTG